MRRKTAITLCFVFALLWLTATFPPEVVTTYHQFPPGPNNQFGKTLVAEESIGYGRYRPFGGRPLGPYTPRHGGGTITSESVSEVVTADGTHVYYGTDTSRLIGMWALILATGALICALGSPPSSLPPAPDRQIASRPAAPGSPEPSVEPGCPPPEATGSGPVQSG